MPGEKTTMRDIAKAMNTSAVTVSKALAGKPGMSAQMRERIIKKAEEMGYEYPGGKRIRVPGPLDIGILIPEAFFEPDSYYSMLYRKLVRRLSRDGHFGLLEILVPDTEKKLQLPNLIQNRHVDGLFLLGQPGKEYYRMIGRSGTPTVFVDFYDEQGTADAVVGDNTYGAYRLTSHLIRLGHTRIGFVGSMRGTSSIMDRYLGYYRAMLMHNLPVREDWLLPDRTGDGHLLPVQLPDELPSAFVCNADVIARRVIQALKDRGVRVPEDVSITGFDDYEIGTAQEPELSTFRVDTDAMMDLAVRLMRERCGGGKGPFRRMVVSGQPVYRQSETAPGGCFIKTENG